MSLILSEGSITHEGDSVSLMILAPLSYSVTLSIDQTTLVYAPYCVGGTTVVAVANLAPT